MPRTSAGLLMYRIKGTEIQVLLLYPGGPYFKNKDDGAWTIPKGNPDPDEDLLGAAHVNCFGTALSTFKRIVA